MADGGTGLGKIITSDDKGRDAVHVAIAPVTATERLFPGQGIILADSGADRVKSAGADEWTGIVDPFLTSPVFPEQRFWMWMRPGSITSLRHEWTHPTLDIPSDPKAKSHAFIEGVGVTLGMTFDGVMEAARTYQQSGRQMVEWRFESMSMPEEFWDHYEVLTGEKIEDRDTFFHCGGCS